MKICALYLLGANRLVVSLKFASNCFLQALLYKDLTQKKQHVLRCDLIKKMI